ncbi:uncharacterized protein PgNI_02681 [Pyricularia grisea]|uniref:Secreted protein n=1 Tax=Pyricularia grisea TaxID=148305 RepID=A0A6P8BBF2_PYRGI|nr:uncharacterized protein PgNI_02681 [Pyricularia grisea]TLD13118.1 hypothetical protein PgNI_02681 [Pyricularia grisea]
MFITTLLNVLWTASTSTRDQVLPVLRVLHSSVNSGRKHIGQDSALATSRPSTILSLKKRVSCTINHRNAKS